jgi:F0F1-type ATP synthase gamma subunit
MSKARFLLRRIQAIKNTQKTTYAMKLVAGAKLKKVQALIDGNRLYEAKLLHSLKALYSDQFSSPLFEGKHSEGPVEVIVVVGSSRGSSMIFWQKKVIHASCLLLAGSFSRDFSFRKNFR